ncbi:MFS transporter [Bradyrhizobium manausense]|uniref:MFS transporter n=1 Tax=Bradyrhizobium manausense TaxID=989370 RepID=UPI001BAC241F|nr:MFS transporter [Bradyrhizobium manausense]MBR0684339.1 MFS transporter [Bradyrhizobium manausense]
MEQPIRHDLNSAARLDRLPPGSFHRRLLVLIGGGLFCDAFDLYIAGAVTGVFLNTGFSTLELNAFFISMTFAGMLLGTAIAGVLSDRFGRRPIFRFNLALFGIASIAGAFAPNMEWLIVTRAICGVGLGAELVLCYATLSEFVPASKRGRWVALLSTISSFGLLTSTLLSWILIPWFGWRIMFVLPGVGALIILWMRKVMPESPRWLETQGRFAEADKIVTAIEAETIRNGLTLGHPEPIPGPQYQSIFQRKLVRPLILGSLMQTVMFAALYGLIAWVPSFLVKQGIPINSSLAQATVMSFGGPIGTFLAFLFVDRIGRRAAIIFGSLAAAIAGLAFGQVTSQVSGMAVGFVVFTVTYFLLATIQAVYLPELYPTAARMRCNSICLGIARLTALGTPFATVLLFNLWGAMGVVTAVSILFVIQSLAMAMLGRETRGQPLELITEGGRA